MLTRSSEEKFLLFLKTNGAQSTATIGKALDMTSEAARQQLTKLEQDGFVRATTNISGVGRPQKIWGLTKLGHAQFPDAHSKLTVQLIDEIRSVLGEEALDRLISEHQREQYARYHSAVDKDSGLEERLGHLADIRTEEGYMAEWEKDEDDYLFMENHCPICAAASACQDFCRAELQTFQKILGSDVMIEREEHIQSGARRCAYRIRKKR